MPLILLTNLDVLVNFLLSTKCHASLLVFHPRIVCNHQMLLNGQCARCGERKTTFLKLNFFSSEFTALAVVVRSGFQSNHSSAKIVRHENFLLGKNLLLLEVVFSFQTFALYRSPVYSYRSLRLRVSVPSTSERNFGQQPPRQYSHCSSREMN